MHNKRIWVSFIVLFLCLATSQVFAVEGELSDDERRGLIDLLEVGYQSTLEEISEIEGEGWAFQPGEEKWSVTQVLEHLMLSEASFFSLSQQALEQPSNPDWAPIAAKASAWIPMVIPDRSKKGQARPEQHPKSEMGREEILAEFKTLRDRSLEFVRTTDLPLKAHTVELEGAPFGPISAYHWLLFMAHHNVRHNKQIEEIKTSSGFPVTEMP